MQKTNNLQEIFLTRARKQNIPVTMFLVNGFQLRGTITGFDCFVVILDSEGSRSSTSTLFPPSRRCGRWSCGRTGRRTPSDLRQAHTRDKRKAP